MNKVMAKSLDGTMIEIDLDAYGNPGSMKRVVPVKCLDGTYEMIDLFECECVWEGDAQLDAQGQIVGPVYTKPTPRDA